MTNGHKKKRKVHLRMAQPDVLRFCDEQRDYLAENIGIEFVGIVARAIDDKYRRYNH